MKKQIITSVLLLAVLTAGAQNRFPKSQLAINGFRNPSIGLEFQHRQLSFHGGYYITALKSGETTAFVKAGATAWFLPFGKQETPSAFYAGASYLRGLTRDYKNTNAFALEAGLRVVIWKGLNLRLGAIALAAKGKDLKINPTPGISYNITLK